MKSLIASPAGLACMAPRPQRLGARSLQRLCRTPRHGQFQLLTRAEGQGQEQQPAASTSSQQAQQAQQAAEDEPVWVRRERERELREKEGSKDLPFGLYLIGSALVAIAAVGSIFEYINHRPVFGLLAPDSPLYSIVLGFFVFTGFPSAGYLFYKAIDTANKEADRMDKLDGY